jgi:predicted AlkP superfamily pyrophosphatase or phosphodiesterase
MSQRHPSVLLVSIDALKPEFVMDTDRFGGLMPALRRHFVEGGAYASRGVKSVLPSFTLPCHQTLITGTYPVTHGICNNLVFDPTGAHRGAWNWFANKRVPTLWQLAKEHGYCSASVAFPTSIGARGDYIVPEFWWDGSHLDLPFLDALCLPQGLVGEMAKDGLECPGGLDLSLDGDRRRKACAAWVLERKLGPRLTRQPFFLSTYFGAYDEAAHVHGVYSPQALATLGQLDALLDSLLADARRIAGEDLVVCVVSDHGTMDNRCCIRPNVLLREAGMITLDGAGRVSQWRAWCQRSGGTAEIRLHDASDLETRARLEELLESLRQDPSSGILDVLSGEQARRERRGFPHADFVIIAQKGHEIRDEVSGDYLTAVLAQRAQHGYSEEFEEMRASCYLAGPGVPAGLDLETLDLVDVAPTLASFMGFPMPAAEGRSLRPEGGFQADKAG